MCPITVAEQLRAYLSVRLLLALNSAKPGEVDFGLATKPRYVIKLASAADARLAVATIIQVKARFGRTPCGVSLSRAALAAPTKLLERPKLTGRGIGQFPAACSWPVRCRSVRVHPLRCPTSAAAPNAKCFRTLIKPEPAGRIPGGMLPQGQCTQNSGTTISLQPGPRVGHWTMPPV